MPRIRIDDVKTEKDVLSFIDQASMDYHNETHNPASCPSASCPCEEEARAALKAKGLETRS